MPVRSPRPTRSSAVTIARSGSPIERANALAAVTPTTSATIAANSAGPDDVASLPGGELRISTMPINGMPVVTSQLSTIRARR